MVPPFFARVLSIVIIGTLWGCGGGDPKRLPEAGYQVTFGPHDIASEMVRGERVSAIIEVKNISPVPWPSKPDSKDRYAVNLSYHWLDRRGGMVIFDGLRTPLPRDLGPGESVVLKAEIQAPDNPGRYTLEVTLVQELSAWFPEKGGDKLVVPVRVVEGSKLAARAGGSAPVQTQARAAIPQKPAEAPLENALAHKGFKDAQKALLKRSPPSKSDIGKAKPAHAIGGPWTVQLASFPEKKTAVSMAEKLTAKGYDAYVMSANIKGKEWFRVRVGRFGRKEEAEKLRARLKNTEKFPHTVVTDR